MRFVGARLLVGEELSEFLRRRGQSGHRVSDAADQGVVARLRCRCQAELLQFRIDEVIDPAPGVGQRFGNRRLEGPVLLVGRAQLDPKFERLLVLIAQRLLRLCGRHEIVAVVGGDAVPQLALVGLARDDRNLAAFACPIRRVGLVQSQVTFAILRIGTVTGEAVLRQDRPDVAVEREFSGARRKTRQQEARAPRGKEAGHIESMKWARFCCQ